MNIRTALRLYRFSLALMLLAALCPLQAAAQSDAPKNLVQKTRHTLIGMARDNVLHEVLDKVKVELLTADGDSTLLHTYVTDYSMNMGGTGNSAWWGVPLPVKDEPYAAQQYILRFSREGYQTQYVNYTVPTRIGRNEHIIEAAPVNMVRIPKEQDLGEATVKATRVKFYAKGDTLVYNADAFQLNEGSMLDALIRQMPGVELKSDGRIYVNGKYVESLLLNGEDFFKGNNELLLENLPTYMVKDVRVYNKAGLSAEMTGQDTGDKSFVMDVKLKKQYNIGWMGNVDVAGGTDDRYLARLFAMRYTDHSRLSFYGSLNNVNETRKPGEDTEWTPDTGGDGVSTIRQGGIDYLINDRDSRFKLNGNAELKHADNVADVRTNSVNFLSGGDTYGQARNTSRDHSFAFNTSHQFYLYPSKKLSLYIKPTFSYERKRQSTSDLSGTFAANPDTYVPEGLLDSLFRPDFNSSLLARTLNRFSSQSLQKGHDLNATLSTSAWIRIPHTLDILNVTYDGAYNDKSYRYFARKQYDYPNADASANSYRNEFETLPERAWKHAASIQYTHYIINGWNISGSYGYQNEYNRKNGSIYRLDRLNQWGETSDTPLGMLPSVTDWESQTLDGDNTTHITKRSSTQVMALYLGKVQNLPTYWWMDLSIPIAFDREQMDYQRPALIDTTMTRHVVYFIPQFNWGNSWVTMEEGSTQALKAHQISFESSITTDPHDFKYAVTLPYDRDPLAITYGNDRLKTAWRYKAAFYYNFGHRKKEISAGLFVNYTLWQNKLAMGYTYNRSTGGYIYTPDNVNGNYQLRGGGNFSFALDKRHRLTLSGNTEANYLHNVDLIGIEGFTNGNLRSTVGTLYLTQGLNLAYNFGKVKLGAKANGTWTHATSERTDFTDISAADFNYGLTFKADLPAAFTLSTDFTVYSRRGYEGHGMNTNDLVWNARLAKRFLANRLTLAVDGFDILHQLSNIRQVVNGQGRTETIRNVIPRYAMLHIIYRFNVLPKKR